MGSLSHEFVLQVLALAGGAMATYGGIRADLKAMHSKIDLIKGEADEAHRRIDRHLEGPDRRA